MYKLVIQLIGIHVTSVCTGIVSFLPTNSRRYTTLCSALLLIYPYTTVDTNSVIASHVLLAHVRFERKQWTTAWKPVLNLSLPKSSVVCFGRTTTTCISGFDFQPRGRGYLSSFPFWRHISHVPIEIARMCFDGTVFWIQLMS